MIKDNRHEAARFTLARVRTLEQELALTNGWFRWRGASESTLTAVGILRSNGWRLTAVRGPLARLQPREVA